jgi:Transposase DNA-binding/Transposase DDE domain
MSLGIAAKARVGEIFRQADLGDPRLVRRAVGLVQALAEGPNRSLPKIWSTAAELEAAYRFLRNPRTEFEALMQAVQQATRERALGKRRVLALHDTTDITCPVAEPEEVGYLQTGQPGFYVHHALCVGCDDVATPLGVLWSQLWGRPQRSKGLRRSMPGWSLAKLEERESDRWVEGVTEAQLWAEGCEIIHVMDREADSYRLFDHLRQVGGDFIVRMRHDRCVEDGHLTEALYDAPIKLRRTVPLSARRSKTMPSYTHRGRAAREAKLVVRCATVQLQPPKYLRESELVELNVVQILEEEPPPGQEPISWVLATSLPVKTSAQVALVLDFYRARWLIEEFHKALKTGCMFEKRQLESFESITTLLAICYPIACELLRLRSRAQLGNVLASMVIRPSLLQCLQAHPKARPLPDNPTAEQALAVIAGLGGHIKYNGPPGWQTLAAGYMELLAFERGWLAAMTHRHL